MVSRDVIFNKEEALNWSKEETAKEKPIADELDEPPQDVPPLGTTPSTQHATPSPTRSFISSEESSSKESLMNQGLIKMRSIRGIFLNRQKIKRLIFSAYILIMNLHFPRSRRRRLLAIAMKEEINAIQKNNTWELTALSQNHKPIGVKWV